MKNTLEKLQGQLTGASKEESLELLLKICDLLNKQADIEMESYVEEALMLSENLGKIEKKGEAYIYQAKFYYHSNQHHLCIPTYQKALKIGEEYKNPLLKSRSLYGIGIAYLVNSDSLALGYFKAAMKTANEANLVEEEIWSHSKMGELYFQQLKYRESGIHHQKAIELAKTLEDAFLLGICYFNYASNLEYKPAIEFLEKAEYIFEKSKNYGLLVRLYGYKSLIYLEAKEYALGIESAEKSMRIVKNKKVSSDTDIYWVYCSRTCALIEQAKLEADQEQRTNLLKKGLESSKKTIELFVGKTKDPTYLGNYSIRAQANYYLGNYQEALKDLGFVHDFCSKTKDKAYILAHHQCTEYLSKTYEALNNIEQAFFYHKKYVLLDQEIKDIENQKQAKILNEQYKTKEKEDEVKRLREVEELKTRFFSQITHELRTPLSLILGPARQVLQTETNKETLQQVQIIERNGSRLLELVNQLLDVNKLEAGKMELKKSHGAFPVFVETIVNAFQTIATQKQIQLDFINNLDELIANFDSDKIEKILYNLLSNAFKFTPKGGQVFCQLTQLPLDNLEQVIVQLTVTDTGRGIAEKDLPHIFNRFYQADNSYTREAEGTGIGLSLVKELVELMEGNITVNSELKKGSHFTIELPLEIGKEEAIQEINYGVSQTLLQSRETFPQVKEKALVAPGKSAPILLLIEDNKDMHTYIRSILEESYIILEAYDGKQGVEMALDRIPDLILSDVMMPEKDGYQVCAEIKEDRRTSHIPVVLLTAKAALESRIEGFEQGADAYLSKPFSAKELKLQLKNLLQTQQSLQEKYRKIDFTSSMISSVDPSNKEESFLGSVVKIVEEHLSDEKFNVEKLSQQMYLSTSQLYRKIQALTSFTTIEFIRDIRIVKGKTLLEEQKGNISEVAFQVGLTPRYFSKCFVKKYGYSPKSLLK